MLMKAALSQRAIALRQSGKSIKEIARELKVSPSSVSRWCTDIVLTKAQRNRLDTRRKEAGIKALKPWIQKNKVLKKEDVLAQSKSGSRDIARLSKRDLFILGLGLYWGEGYKRGSQELGFTNSDPELIFVFLVWLERIYNIPRNQLIARLTINRRYESEIDRVQSEWIKVTGISKQQFTTPSFITTMKDFPNKNARIYRGTLRIKVRRGTSLRRRILASIKEASDQISLNSRNTFS
jgi:transposase-like protein